MSVTVSCPSTVTRTLRRISDGNDAAGFGSLNGLGLVAHDLISIEAWWSRSAARGGPMLPQSRLPAPTQAPYRPGCFDSTSTMP